MSRASLTAWCVDLVLEFGQFVLAVLVAEFLLDRLDLLVEIIFPLGLLHLPLDARPDALLDLQDRDFALHQAEHLLEALRNLGDFQHGLLVCDLHREMRGNRICQLGIILDPGDGRDDIGETFLFSLA